MFASLIGVKLLLFLHIVKDVVMVNEDANEKLINSLLSDYNKKIRPVQELDEPLNLTVDIALNHILDLDEKNQILTSIVWFRLYPRSRPWFQSLVNSKFFPTLEHNPYLSNKQVETKHTTAWHDFKLTWNASEHKGISKTSIYSSQIWVPDFYLYNSASGDTFDVTSAAFVSLFANGQIQWNFPRKTYSTCLVDVTYFPFDHQVCNMTFGSWAFNGNEINLNLKRPRGDLSYYKENVEWELKSFSAVKRVLTYAVSSVPYHDLTYSVYIQRRALHIMFNLVLPVILLTVIAFSAFCLPPEAGEKISLCVTMVISMALILLLIAESLPPTSLAIPLLGEFFCSIVVLLAFSTLMTVFVLQIRFTGKQDKPVPRWVRILVLRCLARITWFPLQCREDGGTIQEKIQKHPELMHLTKEGKHIGMKHEKHKKTSLEKETARGMSSKFKIREPLNTESSFYEKRTNQPRVKASKSPILRKIYQNLEQLFEMVKSRIVSQQLHNNLDKDWRDVAMVIDRCCLLVLCSATLVVALVLLLRRPPEVQGLH